MSPKLGTVCYKTSDEDPFLGREMHQSRQFSEHTQELIDEEVSRILMEADQRAEQLLSEHRADLDSVTRALMEEEELDEQQITELIGESIQQKMKSDGDQLQGTVSSPNVSDAGVSNPVVNLDD